MSGMAANQRSEAKTKRLFALLLGVVFFVTHADAQLIRGYISGTVLDAQAAVVSNVQITAINVGTGSQVSGTTNDLGFYRFVAMEPGTYTLEFRKPGFELLKVQNVQVAASKETTINAPLRTQVLETTLSVTDVPGAELEKGAATIQQTIPGQTLDEIPMTTSSLVPGGARNQVRYAWLAPAVAHVPGQNETSANGHRGRENNYMVDGVGNNDESVTLPALFIPPEAVRELQVQVAPYSAEFGRNIGAQINLVTKNGTNDYHGELWEFYRSSALEPLSLQNRKAGRVPCTAASTGLCGSPRLSDHQFGASLGGPIVADRTFFFGIFQGNLQRQAAKTLGSVTIPTPAGYAALQSAPLRSGQSVASRQAVLRALEFLPEVHSTIAGFDTISGTAVSVNSVPIEVGTFVPVIPQNQNLWYAGFRADHHLTARDQLSYRLHLEDRNTPLATGNLSFGERWAADSQYAAQNHALSYTKIVSDSLVNEARFSFTRLDPSFVERDPVSPTLKITAPNFVIGGVENFPQKRLEETFQFQNVSTHIVSRHSLKFGLDLTRTRSVNDNAPHSKGTWVFQTLEHFLNNSPTSLAQLVSESSRYSFTQLRQAYFFQDDIKVTRNFTLNLGMRYETTSVPLGYFGATLPEVLNAMVPGPGQRDTNNWGPRVGFAYSPQFQDGLLGRIFGAGDSSLRGGFGVSYDVMFHSLLAIPASNYPRNSVQQPYQSVELVDLYPALLVPRSQTPTLTSTTAFVNIPSDAQHPTSNYWSLSLQRQLDRGTVLEVGYTGSRSYHLPRQNQGNPGILTASKAAAVIANCTYATRATCMDSTNPQDPRYPVSPSRLDPNWGSRTLLETTGQAEYHAGYMRLERKVARSIQFGVSYTWSANLSDSEEVFTSEPLLTASSPQVPQNFLDRRNEWSRSVFDRPHRVAAHYSYRIPWFADSPAALQHAFSGWQVSGFTEVQSGQPFTIRIGVDALGSGSTAGARPNYNPGGIMLPDPVTSNFRTFSVPLDGTGIVTAPHVTDPVTGARVFLRNSMPEGGTLGRNTFRGPGFSNTNLSLMKRFVLPGETSLQIRGDFINVFNHDNFPNPDSNMNNAATFGRQTLAPLTDARQVLLGAKIQF